MMTAETDTNTGFKVTTPIERIKFGLETDIHDITIVMTSTGTTTMIVMTTTVTTAMTATGTIASEKRRDRPAMQATIPQLVKLDFRAENGGWSKSDGETSGIPPALVDPPRAALSLRPRDNRNRASRRRWHTLVLFSASWRRQFLRHGDSPPG